MTLVLLMACNQKVNQKEDEVIKQTEVKQPNINIGDTFLISFNWDEKNPFEIIEIDTILILDIKSGYVKYIYIGGRNNKFSSSMEIEYFYEDIKPLNNKK